MRLLVGAAYAVVRAREAGRTRWLVLAGVLVGFAFLTKTAQALLPVPALALAHLWATPTRPLRRVGQLLVALAAMVAAAGWWFALAAVWPDAPYIGGSTDGTAWDLAVGHNGLGRLFGGEGGPGGGPSGGSGILRMFGDTVGGQVAWALPAALLLLVAGFAVTARAARTDRVRASLVVWGGSVLVTALVFSLMEGIFHEYYTVALAPGIAATVAVGGAALWPHRGHPAARVVLAAVIAVTGAWSWVLLARTPEFVPWLRWVVVAVALVAAAATVLGGRRLALLGVTAAVVAASLGPAAYAAETVHTAHTSSIVLAGPASVGAGGMRGGEVPRGAAPPSAGRAGDRAPAAGCPAGGTELGADLVALLQSSGTTWSAATVSTSGSAALALASGTDVMGVGGFTGTDPAPTYDAFVAHVEAGDIGYFVVYDAGRRGGDADTVATRITAWVAAHYPATTVGTRTVYDLAPR